MVKTLPPNASGVGSIPGREAKFPHPTCLMAKNQNIKQKQYYNNVVTIQKTLKMVHIKKKKSLKNSGRRGGMEGLDTAMSFEWCFPGAWNNALGRQSRDFLITVSILET